MWVALLAFEVWFIWRLDDQINFLGDPHAEADAMRAAEGYIADGLTSHHGLARILHGQQFPNEGTVKDHVDENGQVPEKFSRDFPSQLKQRDQWPLTHYPPGAELINGAMARTFGLRPMWKLRALPTVAGLLGLVFLFQTVRRIWGAERGTLVALAIVIVPNVLLWMPTLEFESYALALLMVQSALLLRQFWFAKTIPVWLLPTLFVIGFVQGWLSWDHFFVVSLLALPWWLLRRAEGENPSWKWLLWMTAPPCAGYALAHILHAWQVAAELGGWHAAFNELFRTAAERGGFTSEEHVSRLGYTFKSLYRYAWYCVRPYRNLIFGPFFFLLIIVTAIAVLFPIRRFSLRPRNGPAWNFAFFWPGKRSPIPPILGAALVSTLWLFAMPSHTLGNAHYLVRHTLVLYLCMAIIVAESLQLRREVTDR